MTSSMDEILPGLFLGPWEYALDAEDLTRAGITHVLSVMRMPKSLPVPVAVVAARNTLMLPILDSPTFDILQHLPRCVDFVRQALDGGGRIYVHCQAGISRSATVVTAYIIQTQGLSVQSALEFVRAKRKCVQPNAGFMEQLALWHAAKCIVNSDDQATRLFYHEQTARASKAGRGVQVNADMLARVTEISGAGTGNRIRCKMCRRELAKREHMFPHGPAPTASTSRAAAAETLAATSTPSPAAPEPVQPVTSTTTTDDDQPPSLSSPPTAHEPPMINSTCSGYFVEPLDWMQPILDEGLTSGRIDCPKAKCRAKLGSYDWAGSRCGCGEWVVPGFCIHRSRVDELK
ncbi:dual specificity protein phosphatase 12 [Auriculariales sp. MPI-PUGE-AT-0066]|nr:dual specificity protein phosphatase 12 [Auriculariales sp. MPI-PUGE-AT-0066]